MESGHRPKSVTASRAGCLVPRSGHGRACRHDTCESPPCVDTSPLRRRILCLGAQGKFDHLLHHGCHHQRRTDHLSHHRYRRRHRHRPIIFNDNDHSSSQLDVHKALACPEGQSVLAHSLFGEMFASYRETLSRFSCAGLMWTCTSAGNLDVTHSRQ